MSTFKNAKKSYQKTHKERGQLKNRKHLGLLEKHKDYVLRAKDYHQKQKRLKLLREKAANKNPDEFYFKMVSSKIRGGVHTHNNKTQHSASMLKLMKTQDLNYVQMKKNMEAKKIEKLQANLHLLEDHEQEEQPNQHVIFVDSEKEAMSFDAAKHFNTLPELVSRTYNRPRLETLRSQPVTSGFDEKALKKLQKERSKQYKELKQRIDREKQMNSAAQRMQLQKHLMGKGRRWKVQTGTDDKAPVYKWKKQRKK